MSFAAIKEVLYGKREERMECDIIALLSRIDPILDIPKGKLLARTKLDHPLNNGDTIEVKWKIVIN